MLFIVWRVKTGESSAEILMNFLVSIVAADNAGLGHDNGDDRTITNALIHGWLEFVCKFSNYDWDFMQAGG